MESRRLCSAVLLIRRWNHDGRGPHVLLDRYELQTRVFEVRKTDSRRTASAHDRRRDHTSYRLFLVGLDFVPDYHLGSAGHSYGVLGVWHVGHFLVSDSDSCLRSNHPD